VVGAAHDSAKTCWVGAGAGVGKVDVFGAIGGFGVVVGGTRTTVVVVVDATVVDVVDGTVVDVLVVDGTVVVVEEGSGVVVVVGAGSVSAIRTKESSPTVDAQGALSVRRGAFFCRGGRFDGEAAWRGLCPNVVDVDVDEGSGMTRPAPLSWTPRPAIAKPVPPTRASTDAPAVTAARRCR
jgi:hypothetical protein